MFVMEIYTPVISFVQEVIFFLKFDVPLTFDVKISAGEVELLIAEVKKICIMATVKLSAPQNVNCQTVDFVQRKHD